MKFTHPLARSARVWLAEMLEGEPQKVLTIVTTLELDPEHKKYKPDQVERLRTFAREFLAENPGKAAGFVLMNKPKT